MIFGPVLAPSDPDHGTGHVPAQHPDEKPVTQVEKTADRQRCSAEAG